jgi:hypothetical protein
MILGATDQKLWVFEVFWQGLARAGMCWSQLARVDHSRKKWRAREKKFKKKRDRGKLSKCQPAAGDQGLSAGHGSTPGQSAPVPSFF